MIVGNPSIFAIESGIAQAYERLSFQALGFFVIHVGGIRYGVCAPEASMLASSFDEVERRLARRGTHVAPFSTKAASEIVGAIRRCMYTPDQENELVFGIDARDLQKFVYTYHLEWAPDGDQAFDDGSYVLPFDIGAEVRLIAYKSEDTDGCDRAALRDVRLPSDTFYEVLRTWRDSFEADWATARKVPEDGDQAFD